MTAGWTSYFAGKRVLVTGHTGFKGAWTSLWLNRLGAKVHGLALPPDEGQTPLFNAIRPGDVFASQSHLDIRNCDQVAAAIAAIQPDVLLHLAAQPLVRLSYAEPVATFATNVMGAIHVLEAARRCSSLRAVVVVTSDKCYENREQIWPYREIDALGGHDPYSASKGAAEIAVASYARSFFCQDGQAACATGRAGNVIGGGDFSADRIVPDYMRAMQTKSKLVIRNPAAVRPWQHVLEPIAGYLKLAAHLPEDRQKYTGGWNFGPHSESHKTVRHLADELTGHAGQLAPPVEFGSAGGPHEAGLLKLDISKAQTLLGWHPQLSFQEAVRWTMDWYLEHFASPDNLPALMLSQIDTYTARIRA